MNYKGKVVKIKVYKSFSSKAFKSVIGKVINIHTSQNVRDFNSITLKTKDNKFYSPAWTEYFTIEDIVK